MAKISTYPILSTPTLNDLLIGTDVENLNITKNFSIGDIASFIVGGSYVPYVGATGNVNLGAFNITSSSFIVGGGLATQFLKANGTLDSTVYQPAGNYITQLSGEATASGPGNASVTLSNSAVINKVLTGLTITGSVIVATDSILTAFGKVQNQINTLVGGVQYQGTWNAATNTPTLTSSVGIQGHYYVVSVPGSTNLNGITDWKLGDWAIYNGTAWDKIDNTDAVISVNGEVGAVVLTTTNISEGTNLYFTNSRARTAINLTTTGNSGAATYNNTNGFFNIPEYTLSGLGGVPLTRQLTINGTAFDLSANRSWNVGTVTSVGTNAPLTGGTITGSGTIGITQATSSTDGYLSSTDWTTFNSKQNVITNPVTGTGTAFFLPMWASASSLINSPLSYASDAFTFGYNSATGGTVNFTNSGLTPYTYSIQMNNFGSPRSTIHSYTDGVVVQSIGGTQVSRIFANGNTLLGIGLVDNGNKLEIEGSLKVNTIDNATTDTDRFLVSDSGVIKYRTGTELRSDIGAGVGSVTSVGLTMPSAFSVANSPITGSGTLAVTGAGNASQYVRGDGTLADFPTTTGGGSSVSYYLNGSVSQGTIGGVAYRELSEIPIFGAGTDISIAADGYIASFITDAGDPSLLNIPAGNWNFETYFSASSGGGTPTFYVELYRYDGTTFTLIASSSGTPELISFGTNIQPYFSTLAVPQTALALTDRLAIRYYVATSGRTITLHTEDNHLCQVITTFSNGLTALNGLTEQVQYFQVGTSGTDFNIVSSVATHTFNLPDASASNRGVVTTGTQTFAGYKIFNGTIGANVDIQLATQGTALNTFIKNINATGQTSIGSNGFGFNNANNIYFSGSSKGGGIIAFSNTGNQTYTLQDASGTLAFTSDIPSLTGYVTLGTAQTITAQKTFSTSGSSDTAIINHSSGSGIALNITKGGNGEGLRVTKTSGSGNAVTITGGTLSAEAGQFSGDLQTSTRISATSGSNAITITPNVGGTQNRIETTGTLPLSLVSAAAITMAAGGTTPQITLATTGAVTLTGALNGTSASFSGSVGAASLSGAFATLSNFGSATSTALQLGDGNNGLFRPALNSVAIATNGSAALTLASTGAATFSSSVTAASFVVGNGQFYRATRSSGSLVTDMIGIPSGTDNVRVLSTGDINFVNGSLTNLLTIANSGAATFSSSVTAASGNINGLLSVAAFTNSDLSSSPQINLTRTAAQFTGIAIRGSVAADRALFSVGSDDALHIGRHAGGGGAWTKQVSFLDNGNVGIGTASPAERLHVETSNEYQITYARTSIGKRWALGIDNTGTYFSNRTDSVLPLYITNSGSVGIGTASPAEKLDVVGGALAAGNGTIKTGITYSSLGLIGTFSNHDLGIISNGTERMRITSGGNVLINRNTLSSSGISTNGTLQVNAEIMSTGSLGGLFWENRSGGVTSTSNWYGWFTTGGTIFLFSGNASIASINSSTGIYTPLSDQNKKKDFEESTIGLNEVLNLKPTLYRMKDDESEGEKELGFIAQEVKEFIPQAYVESGEEDAKFIGLNYNAIVAALVKSVQELKTEIDSLKNQIK